MRLQKVLMNCMVLFIAAVYVTSRRGNTLIYLNGYKYYHNIGKHNKSSIKKRWLCSTHNNRGCTAKLYTIDNIITNFTVSRQGAKILLFNGYKYTKHREDNILNLIALLCFFSVPIFTTSSATGKPLICLGGYKFFQKRKSNYKITWNCSTHHSKGCRAAITTIDNVIVGRKHAHNHPSTMND
ncbi:hypothetical protein K1T71_006544 [Dendrolimus kikuchii]|uniref:Uncharacterized protein n=1 Tax=Dendrolimus kikuchii TaxID=765133 RepID=A0ACC1D1E3_9NEOP|nr:hypothetical protein K1T71_006544 [Dendrolimus kikuchii]